MTISEATQVFHMWLNSLKVANLKDNFSFNPFPHPAGKAAHLRFLSEAFNSMQGFCRVLKSLKKV